MIRLLILGTGNMARSHVAQFRKEFDVDIVAAVEVDAGRRSAFAADHGIGQTFADIDAAIAWGGFDAACNVTPDAVHHATTMKLIAAGKAVFCEKPLAMNYPDAREMADAAEAKGIINMVNLTHRASPALEKAREILLSGEIGELRHFEASYMQSWLVGKYWGDWRDPTKPWLWRLSSRHGSRGTVGDIGIHIIDFATYGAASDIVTASPLVRTFHKAKDEQIGEYVLDANDSFVMTAELANGALGTIQASRWATGFANDLFLTLYGTKGALKVSTRGPNATLSICSGADVDAQIWKQVVCPQVTTIFARFAAAVRTGVNGDPNFRRGANLQRVLDLLLESGDGAKTTIRVG